MQLKHRSINFFLQTFHTRDSEEIQNAIKSILVRKVPFVERHGGESFVTVLLKNAQDEILVLLLDAKDGLDRKSIGHSLAKYYSPGRITQALQQLEKQRFTVLRSDRKYVITGPGESFISGIISEMT